jgi:hypothetical protein
MRRCLAHAFLNPASRRVQAFEDQLHGAVGCAEVFLDDTQGAGADFGAAVRLQGSASVKTTPTRPRMVNACRFQAMRLWFQ